MKTVGLLSGTFDPVHTGHVALAQAALRELALAEVWMLVNAYPVGKSATASFDQRLEMVRRATADIPDIIADREPVQRQSQPHSIELARQLNQDYPDHHFVLIMGSDTFAGLDRWTAVDELLQLVSFGVALREAEHDGVAAGVRRRLGESAKALRYHPITLAPLGVSSSKVKRQLQAGEAVTVHPTTYSYIHEQELY